MFYHERQLFVNLFSVHKEEEKGERECNHVLMWDCQHVKKESKGMRAKSDAMGVVGKRPNRVKRLKRFLRCQRWAVD